MQGLTGECQLFQGLQTGSYLPEAEEDRLGPLDATGECGILQGLQHQQ